MRFSGPVVCIASGPSLTVEDCERVRAWGGRSVVVNTSFLRATWADVLYACDFRWWERWERRVREEFTGELWTQDEAAAKRFGLNRIASEPGGGWNPGGSIRQGESSGFQAVGLAIAFGATSVLLLGYDMKPGPKGRLHWHKDHPRFNPHPRRFASWRAHFEQLARESPVPIVNCTRDTALTCFPMLPLEMAL